MKARKVRTEVLTVILILLLYLPFSFLKPENTQGDPSPSPVSYFRAPRIAQKACSDHRPCWCWAGEEVDRF